MESNQVESSRMQFASFITSHQNCRYWHYAIHISEQSEYSLASFIGTTQQSLEKFLCAIGLARSKIHKGRNIISTNTDAWEIFLAEYLQWLET